MVFLNGQLPLGLQEEEKEMHLWVVIVSSSGNSGIWGNIKSVFVVRKEERMFGVKDAVLGDLQKLSGHGPGQPASGDPCLKGSRGPFQPQPFCESVPLWNQPDV